MSSGVTRLSDVVVPAIFSPYVQQMTEQKSRLVRSGAMVADPRLTSLLSGGGLTFNEPSFKDLDDDAENSSTDDPTTHSTPNKIGTGTEIQVRLSRNNSWSSMDLTTSLSGADPMEAIANRVSDYWVRREQAAVIAMMNGIFANNDSTTDAYHTQYDMTFDASGASFVDGVTNFSSEAFIDACTTMGDSMDWLSLVFMHSIVYSRALKNNLIDFIPDSTNAMARPNAGQNQGIPTFLGRIVIVDDGLPNTGGVFETWLFGNGTIRNGRSSPKVPTELKREPTAGNGSGQDVLFNRVEWIHHLVGHAYVGTAPSGGPTNANTTNNLANAASWRRIYSQRKQIHVARLKTREF